MEYHNRNLNVHYSAPQDVWAKLADLYVTMPHWYGYIDGIPYWYGKDGDEKIISASVEPSGLSFYAELPQEEWDLWFALFKTKASGTLGFEVGEPEDGFDFIVYD